VATFEQGSFGGVGAHASRPVSDRPARGRSIGGICEICGAKAAALNYPLSSCARPASEVDYVKTERSALRESRSLGSGLGRKNATPIARPRAVGAKRRRGVGAGTGKRAVPTLEHGSFAGAGIHASRPVFDRPAAGTLNRRNLRNLRIKKWRR
jgi:hypothetical protein